jgi:hypothetical protein
MFVTLIPSQSLSRHGSLPSKRRFVSQSIFSVDTEKRQSGYHNLTGVPHPWSLGELLSHATLRNYMYGSMARLPTATGAHANELSEEGMNTRTLRVWERASLHGLGGTDPDQIVQYSPEEFDSVEVEHGQLVIRKLVTYTETVVLSTGETRAPEVQRWDVVAFVKSEYWHKYHLEEAPVELFTSPTPSWDAPDTRPDEPVQPTDYDDLNPVAIGAFQRADDPFPTADYGAFNTAVERAEPGLHATPDEPDRQPGDPVYGDAPAVVITDKMRQTVLDRLRDKVPDIGKKEEPSATNTTLLGLDAATPITELGNTEVFKTIQ